MKRLNLPDGTSLTPMNVECPACFARAGKHCTVPINVDFSGVPEQHDRVLIYGEHPAVVIEADDEGAIVLESDMSETWFSWDDLEECSPSGGRVDVIWFHLARESKLDEIARAMELG
ncbi:hypothetical protein SEA_HARAMBE_83 [Gordonia phage Harambe]|uniref:Uncharacterized protein n=5 Tax=Woesvirus woes TaxID=1982751 RepID=A0A482JH10_9CAUD|nr:hypothetical protein SEA_ANAMIKA_83 [Gordonia phage Anamika]QAX94366.1 hypothetical protein SEA_GUILLAUME_83 [Gordonia phage Guillaume]QAX94689.1 hypothetical protein SEA_HARAMBE_83 [Gordonia phage Harambe]QBP30656.1 hypothetical protein SEA_LAHIRIUM_84 [Gordonia phage Lahirium]QBP31858.1 hypothetical protein SEA_NIMI13_83 [Gordonia phage Nimi13]